MIYKFRGRILFDYNPTIQLVKAGVSKSDSVEFNMCRFIPEDFQMLSEFFDKIHKHITGQLDEAELTDYIVN